MVGSAFYFRRAGARVGSGSPCLSRVPSADMSHVHWTVKERRKVLVIGPMSILFFVPSLVTQGLLEMFVSSFMFILASNSSPAPQPACILDKP